MTVTKKKTYFNFASRTLSKLFQYVIMVVGKNEILFFTDTMSFISKFTKWSKSYLDRFRKEHKA